MQTPPVPVPPPAPIIVQVPAPPSDPSIWDVLGAIGDLAGGLFAGLAFVIAALVYRRQKSDERRTQAGKVHLVLDPPVTPIHQTSTREQIDKATVARRCVTVTNGSGKEIYGVVLRLDTFTDEGEPQMEIIDLTSMLGAERNVDREFEQSAVVYASINFFDSIRRNWTLDTYGNMWEAKGLSVDKSEVERRDRKWSKDPGYKRVVR